MKIETGLRPEMARAERMPYAFDHLYYKGDEITFNFATLTKRPWHMRLDNPITNCICAKTIQGLGPIGICAKIVGAHKAFALGEIFVYISPDKNFFRFYITSGDVVERDKKPLRHFYEELTKN